MTRRATPATAAGTAAQAPRRGAAPRRGTAIAADVEHLARTDPDLGRAAATAGSFEIPFRSPGFPTILWLIIGQQISIAAAKALFERLTDTLGGETTPRGLLGLDDETMRRCGFTRMKAGYARGLATALLDGSFDLDGITDLGDEEAIEALVSRRGIGRWTAENYLMWALGRRDVFPAGDLALRIGWQEIQGLDEPPPEDELRELAARWAPRRTAASFLIWYAYLGERAGD